MRDGEGMTQGEAGVCMKMSRGTVQRLLATARGKVAQDIVRQKALAISGSMQEYAASSCSVENVTKDLHDSVKEILK